MLSLYVAFDLSVSQLTCWYKIPAGQTFMVLS